MIITKKNINDYIINEVIRIAKKSVPFNSSEFISLFSVMKMVPFESGQSKEAKIFALLSISQNIAEQVDILLKEKYIKKLLDNSDNYILTEKGEDAQDAGSIENYLKNVDNKKRKEWIKEFPKNYWYVMLLGGWLIGIVTQKYIINDVSKNEKKDKASRNDTIKSQQDIQEKNDDKTVPFYDSAKVKQKTNRKNME